MSALFLQGVLMHRKCFTWQGRHVHGKFASYCCVMMACGLCKTCSQAVGHLQKALQSEHSVLLGKHLHAFEICM